MSEDEPLSDLDRRSLRILARSSKTSPTGDRLSARLARAAETGLRQDYEKAEQTFDSLPPEDRLKIGSTAEKQAETERELVVRRKRHAATANAPSRAPTGNDALEWKPIFTPPPAETPAPPPKKPQAKADPAEGDPKTAKPGRPARGKPIIQVDEGWNPEDDEKPWDWRKIPDDPVLNGGRKKKGDAVNPIEELRSQMLGLDAKYGKG